MNGDIVDGRNDILRITTKLLLTITPASTPNKVVQKAPINGNP